MLEKLEGAPGTHCSRMRQVSLVTCILSITLSSLPADKPYCRVMLSVRYISGVLKSKNAIALTATACIISFNNFKGRDYIIHVQ